MKLYICGNGFDLHHNLPTSYNNYKDYLQQHYLHIYKEYNNFPYLLENNDINRWADVESALCIDYVELINQSVQEFYPNLTTESDSRWTEIDIDVENLTEFINDFTGRCFFEWIYKAEKYNPMADLNLEKNSIFINFNYTNTLQRLYNIPESSILHIHGALKNLDGKDILWKDVLPNVYTPEEAEALGPIEEGNKWSNGYIRKEIQFGATGITPKQVAEDLNKRYQDDDFYSVSIEPAINKLVDFVEKSTKLINKNYEKLIKFLDGKNINEVVVMGISLGEADEPYFSDILIPRFKNIKWTFMQHGKESERIRNFIHRYSLLETEVVEW